MFFILFFMANSLHVTEDVDFVPFATVMMACVNITRARPKLLRVR